MSDLSNNACGPLSTLYLSRDSRRECKEGVGSFVRDLHPLEKVRHEIGAARMLDNNTRKVQRLKKMLVGKAANVDRKYKGHVKKCDDLLDNVSCGYVGAYDYYIELFGSLSAFKTPSSESCVMSLKALHQGLIFTRGFYNNTQSEVMYDTGNEMSVLSDEFSKEHMTLFKGVAQRAARGVRILLPSGLGLHLGCMTYYPVVSAASEQVRYLDAVEDGNYLEAVMGAEFMLRNPFEVDYDNRTITFGHDVVSRVQDGGWQFLPFYLMPTPSGVFLIGVDVYVNGSPKRLLFDTGSNSTAIVEACLKNVEVGKEDSSVAGFYDTSVQKKTKREVEISLGNIKMSSMMSIMPDSSPQATMMLDDGYCGILGMDLFVNFDYIFDPDSHGIYFRKRDKLSASGRLFHFGIEPRKVKQGILIEKVAEGSIADVSGLKEGDIITEINDREAAKMSLLAFYDIQVWETDEMSVEILREGETHCLTMKISESPK